MKTTFAITGMHCPACVQRLTEAFQKVPGVTSAHVTLAPPGAVVEARGDVTMSALDQAARSAGSYEVIQTAASVGPHQAHGHTHKAIAPTPSLYPLILIVLYIAGACALATYFRAPWSWRSFMLDFMSGFFLVFSFFKLLDLRGFADAYQSYDVVAGRSRSYALAYPFLELALGVAYLVRWEPTLTSALTLAVMLISSVGVLRALLRKNAIRCACLGTALNLPMTTVTLVEDLGMAAMAGAALLWGHGSRS